MKSIIAVLIATSLSGSTLAQKNRIELYREKADDLASLVKSNYYKMLSFESGFDGNWIKVITKNKETVYEGYLTTNPKLGVARSNFYGLQVFPIIVTFNKREYRIGKNTQKFIYINLANDSLIIQATGEFKLYR